MKPSRELKRIQELSGVIHGYMLECSEVEQILGKALGFMWYKDDQENFPGATEEDGVCIGDNTAVSLAQMAADKIESHA